MTCPRHRHRRGMFRNTAWTNALGRVYQGDERRAQFMNIPGCPGGQYSEATARESTNLVRRNMRTSTPLAKAHGRNAAVCKKRAPLAGKGKILGEELGEIMRRHGYEVSPPLPATKGFAPRLMPAENDGWHPSEAR
jgi:hypothetical protein